MFLNKSICFFFYLVKSYYFGVNKLYTIEVGMAQ